MRACQSLERLHMGIDAPRLVAERGAAARLAPSRLRALPRCLPKAPLWPGAPPEVRRRIPPAASRGLPPASQDPADACPGPAAVPPHPPPLFQTRMPAHATHPHPNRWI